MFSRLPMVLCIGWHGMAWHGILPYVACVHGIACGLVWRVCVALTCGLMGRVCMSLRRIGRTY